MTGFNLLSIAAFTFLLIMELSGKVTMTVLSVFMGFAGFAAVLPVALPFQIYSMAIGGVRHVGLLIAAFELCAQLTLAFLELGTGAREYHLVLPSSTHILRTLAPSLATAPPARRLPPHIPPNYRSGRLLDAHSWTTWLVLMVCISVPATIFMAMFYYLEWARAPLASNMIAGARPPVHAHRATSLPYWTQGRCQHRQHASCLTREWLTDLLRVPPQLRT